MSFRIVCRPPGENLEGRLHSHPDDKQTLPRAALVTFLAVHVEKKNSLKQLAERVVRFRRRRLVRTGGPDDG
jgi:hypothetical protein